MKKVLFVFAIMFLGLSHISCAKIFLWDEDPDTVLHEDSKYIAVFGDLQMYFNSTNNMLYYQNSLEWIVSHNDRISFMMHTGDVTDHNYIYQWENFHSTTEPYTGDIPFYTCVGNHDYLCNASDPWNHRDSTRFSEYVGFPSTVSHIIEYYEYGKYENVLVREELFDNDLIYLLILEMEPRKAVIRWADSLMHTMPDENVVLITHRYLNTNAVRYQSHYYMTDSESSSPQYVWDNLVYNNDNIRCVLCGHVGTLPRVLYSTNAVGRIVPQIEFNIQRLPYGGNGVIELWEFDRQGDCYVRTYNTHTEQFVNDTLSSFQFKFR